MTLGTSSWELEPYLVQHLDLMKAAVQQRTSKKTEWHQQLGLLEKCLPVSFDWEEQIETAQIMKNKHRKATAGEW